MTLITESLEGFILKDPNVIFCCTIGRCFKLSFSVDLTVTFDLFGSGFWQRILHFESPMSLVRSDRI